jgi:ABC-type glutathione transport system ATPase component
VSSSIPSSASYEPTRRGLPAAAAPLLELQNLSTHYVSAQGTRVIRAVDDVSLRIHAGETLGIVGEPGSGKSTLALTILRILPPAARIVSAKMLFAGEDLLEKSDAEMRRVRGKRIAMILQDPMTSLNPLFTIGDQIPCSRSVTRSVSRSGCTTGPRVRPPGAARKTC